jgi:hypothetical protein
VSKELGHIVYSASTANFGEELKPWLDGNGFSRYVVISNNSFWVLSLPSDQIRRVYELTLAQIGDPRLCNLVSASFPRKYLPESFRGEIILGNAHEQSQALLENLIRCNSHPSMRRDLL